MKTILAALLLLPASLTVNAWELDPAAQRALTELGRQLRRAQSHPNSSLKERLEWTVRSALLDIRAGVVEGSESRLRAALPARREDWTPEQRAQMAALQERKDAAYEAVGAAGDMSQLYSSPDAVQLIREYTTCVEGRKKAYAESVAKLDALMTPEEKAAEAAALKEALASIEAEAQELRAKLPGLSEADAAPVRGLIEAKEFSATRFSERLRTLTAPG